MSVRFEWVPQDYRVVIQKNSGEKSFDRRIVQLAYREDDNGDVSIEGLIFDNDGQLVPISEVEGSRPPGTAPIEIGLPRRQASRRRLAVPRRFTSAVRRSPTY